MMTNVRHLTPGHPLVYKTTHGTWASVTWTRDPSDNWTIPQANTSHPTWGAAMARVRRWYGNGKSGTY